jgi:hypothetical protein
MQHHPDKDAARQADQEALRQARLQDPSMGLRADPDSIPGWGADLDPADRPAYPKERTPPRLDNVHWTRPEQQQSEVEIFHSTERAGLTPVFGTSVPPSGLSGVLRRRAFRRSENDVRHWMMLLLADRVNVVEGLFEDLRKSSRGKQVASVAVVVLAGWWLARR